MTNTNIQTNDNAASILLHAQPYDITASGFYFDSVADFAVKAAKLRNDHGEPVEEFEIQFIDGKPIDCELAQIIGLNQANVPLFFDAVDEWGDEEKTRVILAVGEFGYELCALTHPGDFDIDIYHIESMRELAEQFVEDGLFGDIPERLASYIDFDAIARDLSVDYAETTIAGERLIYRSA